MKILLLNSPVQKKRGNEHMFRYPPLGLLYLASFLESEEHHNISFLDAAVCGKDKVLKKIIEYSPDIIAISFTTPSSGSAFELMRDIKSSSDIPIVIGGPHVTALPKETLSGSNADFAVLGEGEQTFSDLIKNIENGGDFNEVDGIAFKSRGKIVLTKKRKLISNIDILPHPARHLIDFDDYPGYPLKKGTETTILTSRGCPNNCFFCANVVWRHNKPWIRTRSPENIVDELLVLRDIYHLDEFYDYSDEFNCITKWSIDVCEKIKRENIDMYWKCQLYPKVSSRLAQAMADSGCWFSLLGIESGNTGTLKGIKKNYNLESVRRSCRNLKRSGIKLQGNFMLFNIWEEGDGLKYENLNENRNTIMFARNLLRKKLLDYCSFQITTPYPGSKLFEFSQRKGLISNSDYSDMDSLNNQIFALPGIKEKEVYMIKRESEILQALSAIRSGSLNLRYMVHFLNRIFNDINRSIL